MSILLVPSCSNTLNGFREVVCGLMENRRGGLTDVTRELGTFCSTRKRGQVSLRGFSDRSVSFKNSPTNNYCKSQI